VGAQLPPAPTEFNPWKHCDQRVCLYAVVRSSSDNNAIRNVLPVLWMTSCSAHSWGRSLISSTKGCHQNTFTTRNTLANAVVHPGAKSAIPDCLVSR